MQTPKTLKGRDARYAEFYDAVGEVEFGGGDSDDGRDYRDSAEDSAKNDIRRLSLDDAERDRGQYLKVQSHASIDKIAEFEITVVATSDDEEGDEVECQPSRRLGQLDYDYDDNDDGREGYLDSEGASDHHYIDAGLANEKRRSGNSREDPARPQRNSARTQWNSAGPQSNSARQQPNSASHRNPVNPPPDHHIRLGQPSDRQDNYGRRGDSRERSQYGPCAACGGLGHSVHVCRKRCKFYQQVHDVGRCELFQRYERPANFVTQNSAEPVTEAKYIFTYVGEAEGPEDEKKSDGNGSDMDGIDGELGYSERESPAMMSNADTTRLETGATGRTKTMRLLPGERLGWWSA
ncbi:unnamed protein product [Phytophthora fragariaefolia]|uniref:Unnamed protein product n=1 Tax=Phytophthora fragariaefolia TaxID=1490495 RepID=A0A9W6XCG5_9STRA|nr:unnamed protein product [Phytophthora fragariaefolia]